MSIHDTLARHLQRIKNKICFGCNFQHPEVNQGILVSRKADITNLLSFEPAPPSLRRRGEDAVWSSRRTKAAVLASSNFGRLPEHFCHFCGKYHSQVLPCPSLYLAEHGFEPHKLTKKVLAPECPDIYDRRRFIRWHVVAPHLSQRLSACAELTSQSG